MLSPALPARRRSSVRIKLEKWSATVHLQSRTELFLVLLHTEGYQFLLLLNPLLLLLVLDLHCHLLHYAALTDAVSAVVRADVRILAR